MKRTFVGNVHIDHVEGQVFMDGVRLPWYFANEGPTIEKVEGIPMHLVHLPVFVEGVITLVDDDGTKTSYDPVLGNVRKWASDFVRRGFAEAYPSLNLPQEAL